MDIDSIIPYEGNARHNDGAVETVAASIADFGLKGQIVLESRDNPVIVAGHTRWKACKSLGWTEIPDERIDFCDGMTPAQIKAFRLADNRTGEIATWNIALLKKEMKELDGQIDMSRYRFDFKSKVKPYGAERLKTDQAYNLDLVNINDCGPDGMPMVKGCMAKPEKLLGFNYAKTAKEHDRWLHFFIDDYQFERLWNKPKKYLDLIKGFQGVLSCDFSLYLDMPYPMQRWNEYRRRALQHYWEENGVKVVPTLSWSTPESYGFCFSGLPKNSTVAVSTVGVANDEDAKRIWHAGMAEALARLSPKRVLLYGSDIDFTFDCEVVRYKAEGRF